MQQTQHLVEHVHQNLLRGKLAGFVFAVEPGLRQLDIPVAVGVPDEVVDLAGCDADLVCIEICRDFANERVELREHPLVLQLQILHCRKTGLVNLEVHEHIAACVPDLVGKVAHCLALFHVEAHVVAGRVAGNQIEAQRVCAVLLRHFQRVDAVAE